MADILLVHGSCHGAWCWRDMIAPLTALGHSVRALDLPGAGADRTTLSDVTLDGYAQAVARECRQDTVLVGHSMGGYAIAAAAEHAPEKISRLVYVCAYVPQDGVTLAEMRKQAPYQPLMAAVTVAPDRQSFAVDSDAAPALFYHDCSAELTAYALAHLRPQAIAPTETALRLTSASQDLPRRYIRCQQDRTIPPEFQVTMTQDWPTAHVHQMACSHSPFFADPTGLAARIDLSIRD